MSFSFGMNDLVPMVLLQTQQTKHFSCHWRVLYSIFFIPAERECRWSQCDTSFAHQPWRRLHIRHIGWRTGRHSKVHSRFCPPLNQTACPQDWFGTEKLFVQVSPLFPDLTLLQRKQASCQCFSLYERSFESIPMIFPHSSQLLANTFS